MNIVILTSKNHFYANQIIKFLIKNFPKEIKLIIESDALIPGESKIAGLRKYLEVSGFYYVLSQIIKQLLFQFLSIPSQIFKKDNFFYSYKNFIKEGQVENWETLKEKNNLMNRIKRENPDLIISVFSKYILPKDILDITQLALNIHPSFLPNHRGVSPTFWVLANNDKETGVSIHIMDEEIDRGPIIVQEKITLEDIDTEHSLYLKCCQRGQIILKNLIDSMVNNKFSITHQVSSERGSYFSLPTKEAVERFRKNRRKFFTLREIISIF